MFYCACRILSKQLWVSCFDFFVLAWEDEIEAGQHFELSFYLVFMFLSLNEPDARVEEKAFKFDRIQNY